MFFSWIFISTSYVRKISDLRNKCERSNFTSLWYTCVDIFETRHNTVKFCPLQVRYEDNHCKRAGRTPIDLKLNKRMLWSIRSKALEKSKKIIRIIVCGFSRAENQVWSISKRARTADDHEIPPNWHLLILFFESSNIQSNAKDSCIFENTLVSANGLMFSTVLHGFVFWHLVC